MGQRDPISDPSQSDTLAVGIATLIWFSADSAAQANIVETATFAATAATLWWFGDRAATTFRAP